MGLVTELWGRFRRRPINRLKAQFVDEAAAVELARARRKRLSVTQGTHHAGEVLKSEAEQGVFPISMATLNVSGFDDVVSEAGDGRVEGRDSRGEDNL